MKNVFTSFGLAGRTFAATVLARSLTLAVKARLFLSGLGALNPSMRRLDIQCTTLHGPFVH